jgi:hypothetical protein
MAALQHARAKVPFSYKPVETRSSLPPLRMPYEGCPEHLTVGEFAVGVGCFMASAIASGLRGAWMSDLGPDALAVAATNCPSVPTKLGSMFEQDPNDLPWAHVLVGGACCQPLSKMSRQRGWEDERAYSTLRMLHNTATLQPWFMFTTARSGRSSKVCSAWRVTRFKRSKFARHGVTSFRHQVPSPPSVRARALHNAAAESSCSQPELTWPSGGANPPSSRSKTAALRPSKTGWTHRGLTGTCGDPVPRLNVR